MALLKWPSPCAHPLQIHTTVCSAVLAHSIQEHRVYRSHVLLASWQVVQAEDTASMDSEIDDGSGWETASDDEDSTALGTAGAAAPMAEDDAQGALGPSSFASEAQQMGVHLAGFCLCSRSIALYQPRFGPHDIGALPSICRQQGLQIYTSSHYTVSMRCAP